MNGLSNFALMCISWEKNSTISLKNIFNSKIIPEEMSPWQCWPEGSWALDNFKVFLFCLVLSNLQDISLRRQSKI